MTTTESLVSLTINKKNVSVLPGTTVIEAAKKSGIHIPHFCWHPGLSIAGVCRFCMVKIEGNPKLQIGCNTVVSEGMKVDTLSEEVKEAHKWALEFHLINHPLDCPICDQAGECELQNFYMKVGQYDSQMSQDKVLKPKALDIGDTLILDTERCILCSRCVRFEDEVTKTSALGIFNRGDKAVIGTNPGKKVTHNYSYNLADICPVGAFTAKDFRFKCRVWFLKETKSICPGCSTGCNVVLYQNKNQREYYRLKPLENQSVNGFWMCDYGRTMFEHLNAKNRLSAPEFNGNKISIEEAKKNLWGILNANASIALIVTPQYTNEEYDFIFDFVKRKLKNFKIYIWREKTEKCEEFDGLLMRGDKNPNTQGLKDSLNKLSLESTTIKGDWLELKKIGHKHALVLGPENLSAFPSWVNDIKFISESVETAVVFGNYINEEKNNIESNWLRIPTLTFAEKNGHFTNFLEKKQKLTANPPVFPEMKDIQHYFKEPIT